MQDDGIPWKEHATAVGRSEEGGDDSATLLFEGSLLQAAIRLSHWTRKDLRGVRVSLPDRHAAPRSFQGSALEELITRSKVVARRVSFGVSA